MRLRKWLVAIYLGAIVLIWTLTPATAVAPLAIPLGGLALSAGYAGYRFIKGYAIETCNSVEETHEGRMWIRNDRLAFQKLQENLDRLLYGQHIAKKIVLKAMKSHLEDKDPVKALVMSFHGWTGSGKNHVTRLIADAIFKLGPKSDFMTHIFGSHYQDVENLTAYKNEFRELIRRTVEQCPRQLFILDEVDKMAPGLLDVIAPYLDYHTQIQGVDFRKSIFIFLSNTGGYAITNLTHEHWKNGHNRDDLKLSDFEVLISRGAFNERGGFQKSDIITKSLIDHYVPFLPLEKKHIKLCARDVFKDKYPHIKVTDDCLKRVADELEYSPPTTKLFSTTGCKRVQKKVDIMLCD